MELSDVWQLHFFVLFQFRETDIKHDRIPFNAKILSAAKPDRIFYVSQVSEPHMTKAMCFRPL